MGVRHQKPGSIPKMLTHFGKAINGCFLFSPVFNGSSIFSGVTVAMVTGALLLLLVSSQATARRTKNVAYLATDTPGFDAKRHLLDVYTPRHPASQTQPVVIFIHGGNWNSGNKNFYAFIGRRLARQGLVAVVINYRLSPGVQVPEMVDDCAHAVQWVSQHIAGYGGDPNRIFVMGHSAGGGLAALLATDDARFSQLGFPGNPIKGAILDDAAGLDMFGYLKKMAYPGDEQYLVAFGKNPAVWRQLSPLYHLRASSPPMLVYVGEHTYPSIASSNDQFQQSLRQLGIEYQFKRLPGKKHVGMVLQLFWKNNVIYQDLRQWIAAK